MSQTIKTLAVNAFIAWPMNERPQILTSKEDFGGIDHYRDVLNGVQSFADFVLDVSRELLIHAHQISMASRHTVGGQERNGDVDIPGAESASLRAMAGRRKNKRVAFFNSEDGIKLRLEVRPHNQRQLPGTIKYYCLCGSSARRRRTTFKCSTCDFHLCARTHPGQRKSCWGIWHEAKRLTNSAARGALRTLRRIVQEQTHNFTCTTFPRKWRELPGRADFGERHRRLH